MMTSKKLFPNIKIQTYREKDIAARNFADEEKVLLQENAVKKTNHFTNSSIITAVKHIIFDETSQRKNLQVDGPARRRNYVTLQEAVRYIVENVMELTPGQYDAIYSTELNSKTSLAPAIRKIVINASSSICSEALFDSKKILFLSCWPEYYHANYPKPTPWEIFDASGTTRASLIRASKIKEWSDIPNAKKERKRVYNHGNEVDSVVYWAMQSVFSMEKDLDVSELFLSLAQPTVSGWSRYGFCKIIEARGCYPTPLDFYLLNSPAEYQMEHFEEYIEAREKAGLASIEALETFYRAYKNIS